jgi:hypothetical protein
VPTAAVVAGALLVLLSGAQRDTYSERSLCDLMAGAQCYATSCEKDAKERCQMVSQRCKGATEQTVPQERADKSAACARAMLQNACGAPAPEECAGVL